MLLKDFQLLQEALIKEFANPESEQGLVTALETRQERHETSSSLLQSTQTGILRNSQRT